ncbi:MAG: hypothetical protein KC503_26020 [Myxococcales bacterium]|nr:hypothetical protein [Myxococcales bacterium]
MKHVIPFAIALAVAFCTTTAHANGALALHTEAQLAQIDGLPSPAKALVGPLLTTMVPMSVAAGTLFSSLLFGSPAMFYTSLILAGGALAIGPSIGQFYVGNTLRGLLTAAGRTALISSAVFFAAKALGESASDGSVHGGWLGASVGCAMLAVGLAIWDLVDAPLTAARMRREARRRFAIAPMLRYDQTSGRTLGLAGAITF